MLEDISSYGIYSEDKQALVFHGEGIDIPSDYTSNLIILVPHKTT